MLGYQKLSPVIIIIVIMTVKASLQIKTLFHIFKRVDMKAMQWWAGTWADDDSDGNGDEEENGTAITTEWERSCSSPEKKKNKTKKKNSWDESLARGYFLSSLNEI